MEKTVFVENAKGEFVTRKESAKKIYEVTGYNRSAKKWELTDVEDICRTIEVKKGTKLFLADY